MRRCKSTLDLFLDRPKAAVLAMPMGVSCRAIWAPLVDETAESILNEDFEGMFAKVDGCKVVLADKMRAIGATESQVAHQFSCFRSAVFERYEVKCESG